MMMPINIIDNEEIDYYIDQLIKNTCSCIDLKIARIMITNAFNAGRWNMYLEDVHNKIEKLTAGEGK